MNSILKKILPLFLIISLSSGLVYATDTKLEFTNTELVYALKELSKFYSINLIYRDELVKDKKVTCSLNSPNSDMAIQQLISLFDLDFKKVNENTYVLYYKTLVKSDIDNKTTNQNYKQRTSVLIPPKVISDIKIPYPKMAQDNGFEGSVDMKILINESGNVETVKIQKSSNSIILDKAAVEYTKLIKFKPAQRDSQYISVWSKWKIIFDLIPSDTSYSEVVFESINE